MNFADLVNHRRVFVVGSASAANIGAYMPSDHLVAVNASFSPFPTIVPDTLIINAYSLQDRNEVQRTSKSLLRDRAVKHLVALTTACSLDEMLSKLAEAGLKWQSVEELTREQRRYITEQALGRPTASDRGNDIASTGVTVIAWAVLAGASSIRFSGFSLAGGHSYIPGETPRSHVDVDREVFLNFGVVDPQVDGCIETGFVKRAR
jgi:hypothetical protein